MNGTFKNYLLTLKDTSEVFRAMQQRRQEIIDVFDSGEAVEDPDLFAELVELDAALDGVGDEAQQIGGAR